MAEDNFYFNEEGLLVMTRSYLERRGFCCGNGCFHCPFEYENVIDPEKKASLLLSRSIEANGLNRTDPSDDKSREKKDQNT